MDYNTACFCLGIKPGESIENIKKAYINACKMYHPDNVHSDIYINQYNQCQEAYNFLCSYVAEPVKSVSNRVISSKGSYSYDHNSYVKKQQAFKKKSEEKKIRELKDIIAKSKELQQNNSKLEHVNYKSEDDILNQIRWLRVAQIIHDTIEADKAKGDNK